MEGMVCVAMFTIFTLGVTGAEGPPMGLYPDDMTCGNNLSQYDSDVKCELVWYCEVEEPQTPEEEQ